MRFITLTILLLYANLIFSKKMKEGYYRGVLFLDEEKHVELPFNFEFKLVNKKPLLIIRNADERIAVNEITMKGDSLNFKMPVFDTEFRTKIIDGRLEGIWYNNYRKEKNKIKFIATFNEPKRFLVDIDKSNTTFEGNWETTFSPNKPEAYKAIGQFHHVEQSNLIYGTFFTETGDYRYLEGSQVGNQIYLSCFDGSHAFLFIARIDSSNQIVGQFYSGSHWKEEWIAIKNDDFKLRNSEEITVVRNNNQKINFSFQNTDDKFISINDKIFENKVVLLQIMGSWCPNCMDESAYLTTIYNQYKNYGLEIIAIAFEKTNDTSVAKKQLLRLKNKFEINYNILITGLTGKAKASEVFPMLNDISSFPTLIFLNKQHQIVKVHTGFNGPATGKAFEDFKLSTETFINHLIKQ